MTFWRFTSRSLRFHARQHVGVLLGTAVAATVLIGALIVGDSVRGSLREMALSRLAGNDIALDARDRLFLKSLAKRVEVSVPNARCTPLLRLPGTANLQNGTARANAVQVWGVDALLAGQGRETAGTIPANGIVLNEALAARLNAKRGDTVILRIRKPS